jgi:hypothetical protein
MMGMGFAVNWNATAAVQMLPSLFGHLIYGAILGVTCGTLARQSWAGARAGQTTR